MPKKYSEDEVAHLIKSVELAKTQSGLKTSKAISKFRNEWNAMFHHNASQRVLEQLYYRNTKTERETHTGWFVLAINNTSGKAEMFKDSKEIQSKLGTLASGYSFYKARQMVATIKTEVKLR